MDDFLVQLGTYVISRGTRQNEILKAVQDFCDGEYTIIVSEGPIDHKKDIVYIQFEGANPKVFLNTDSIEILME